MHMRFFLHSIYFVAVSFLLGGCLEITEIYTLNPDGSGKVIHEAIFSIAYPETEGNIAPEKKIKKEILAELEHAKGVEVWDDVTYRYEGQDKIYFKGTAYFKDLSKLKFHHSGVNSTFFDLIVFSCEEGQLSLELKSSKADEESDRSEATTAKKRVVGLTEAEIEQKLAENKKEISKTKMMLAELFSDLKIDRTFYLPGTLAQNSNFEHNLDGSVRNNFEGSKLLALMTANLENDEWLRQQIRIGQDVEETLSDEYTMNGHLFGQEGPVQVIMTKTEAPLFDYTKEVTQAKINYKNFLAKLAPFKLPLPIKVDPATVGKFFVAGIRYVAFDDAKNGIQPLGYRQGYTLAVVGTLPEQAQKLLHGKVETALTDTGDSLLPERVFDQEINSLRLGNDGRTVLLELKLNKPGQEVKSLQKISGTFVYMTSPDDFSLIDLGINKFEKGVEGNALGAKVISAGTDSLDIQINAIKESFKSVKLFNEQGNKVDTIYSYTWSASSIDTIIGLRPMRNGEQLPLEGRIELEALATFKVHEFEFNLTDIPLFGR